jgi:hypothetical protein
LNPIWGAIVGAAVVLVVQFGTTAYLSGKVVGKIDALDGRLTRNEQTDKEQWHAINAHETRISKIQGKLQINGD